MDERTYLKVKIKSLAEEARIIRKETKRAKRVSIKNGLAEHRKGVVRNEARHTHLAYGFLRGREYRQMEPKAHETPNWDKVRKMVSKYGTHFGAYGYENWKQERADREELLRRFDAWLEQANKEIENHLADA